MMQASLMAQPLGKTKRPVPQREQPQPPTLTVMMELLVKRVSKLQAGSAAGFDGIQAEFIKHVIAVTKIEVEHGDPQSVMLPLVARLMHT